MIKPSPPAERKIVFLVDIDNTLLDNDRFGSELSEFLERQFGQAGKERYWRLYEERRTRLGFADYLGALEDFRAGQPAGESLLEASAYLLDYPFAKLAYPGALEAVAHLRTLGTVVILSDGDVTFQSRKIRRSGIWAAVEGRVLICVHKQDSLEVVQSNYPGDHYAVVDDKPTLLAAMKLVMGTRLTSVWVRQGHYAAEAANSPSPPTPNLVIDNIAGLTELDPRRFHSAAA